MKKEKLSRKEVKNLSKEERKEYRKERRIRRKARCRFLKNLLIWLMGFLALPIVLAATLVFVPIKTFTNLAGVDTSTIVSEQIASKSIIKAATGFSTYSLGDFAIVTNSLDNLIKGTEYKDVVKIDTQKLNAIKFSEIGGAGFTEYITSCVKIDLTLDKAEELLNAGIYDFLGEEIVNSLSTFEQVTEDVDTTAEGFNPNYYYAMQGSTYVRAFDNEGNYANGVTAGEVLYYPALTKVQIGEVPKVLSDCLGRVSATQLMSMFIEITEDSLIDTILGEKTVGELGTISVDGIKVTEILPDIDADTLDLLCEAVGVDDAESLTIGNIEGLNINNVKLESIIARPTDEFPDQNKELWDLLESAVTPENPDGRIRLSDLKNGFVVDNVTLNSVLPKDDSNKVLYDILFDVTGKSADEMTINDLSSFNTDGVKLNSVMPKTDQNQKLYDILKDSTGAEYDAVTIADLQNFTTGGIRLESVLERNTANANLWDILDQAITPADAVKGITIDDLSTFDVKKIEIGAIIDRQTDGGDDVFIWKILDEAVTPANGSSITINDIENSFDIDRVTLKNVLPQEDNQQLSSILAQATNKEYAQIKISDLSGSFDLANVKLNTMLDNVDLTANPLLNALAGDDTVTLSNIAQKANEVKLSEIYADESAVFTTNSTNTFNSSAKYVRETVGGVETYTLSSSGTYYISKSASVWMFIFYTGSNLNTTTGNYEVYTSTEVTYGDLSTTMENVGDKIAGATIRQLVDCGILQDKSTFAIGNIYAKSLNDSIGI